MTVYPWDSLVDTVDMCFIWLAAYRACHARGEKDPDQRQRRKHPYIQVSNNNVTITEAVYITVQDYHGEWLAANNNNNKQQLQRTYATNLLQ